MSVYEELELYIWPAPILFKADIDGNHARGSIIIKVRNVDHDYGGVADLLLGTTLLVEGATSGGANDTGRIRVRGTSSPFIYVAENDFEWSDGQHLTGIKFFEVWGVAPRITVVSGVPTFYKDYNIPYNANQNRYTDPVIIMGPNYAGPSNEPVYYSASGTYDPQGATITNYAWSFEVDQSGTPLTFNGRDPGLINYPIPGNYLTTLAVTTSDGKTFQGRRHIMISNTPQIDWGMTSFTGDADTGGYTAKLWTRNWPAELTEGALIFIRCKSSIRDSRRPHTFFVGYVSGETLKFNWSTHVVEFEAVSLNIIMDKLDVFGATVQFKPPGQDTTWFEIPLMTADKAVAHFLRWHTTAMAIADFHPTGDTRQLQNVDFERGGGANPCRNFYQTTITADMRCDAQGTFWAEMMQQFLPLASRSSLVLNDVTPDKWRGQPQIVDAMLSNVSYVEAGGVAFSGATGTFQAYLAGYPGNVPGRFGRAENVTGLAVNSQTQLSELVGHIWADKTSRNPEVIMSMAGNYREYDIAPFRWSTLSLQSDFINWVAKRLQLTRVSHVYQPGKKVLLTDITFKPETWGVPGVTVTLPPVVPSDPEPPSEPPIPVPSIPLVPTYNIVVVANDHQIGYSANFFEVSPMWVNIKGGALASATGHISCFDVAPTGEAWLCTTEGYAGANPDLNGIFYCNHIMTGNWVLVKSETVIRTEVNNVGDGYIESLSVDDDGTVWIPITKGVAYPTYGTFQYYTGSGGSLGSPVLRQCVPPDVSTDAGRGYIGAKQFNCRSNGTVSWVGIAGLTPGYWDFSSDVYVPIWLGFPSISEVAPITNLLTTLGHVCAADGSVLHTGAAPEYPLVADSGVVYWARNADGYLMQDGIVLAIPNNIPGTDGIFSTSGATGGGYTTVNTPTEVIWIARTAKAQNSKRNIAYTADGGVDGWWTKDGDWETKIGAWIASFNVPMVKYVEVT